VQNLLHWHLLGDLPFVDSDLEIDYWSLSDCLAELNDCLLRCCLTKNYFVYKLDSTDYLCTEPVGGCYYCSNNHCFGVEKIYYAVLRNWYVHSWLFLIGFFSDPHSCHEVFIFPLARFYIFILKFDFGLMNVVEDNPSPTIEEYWPIFCLQLSYSFLVIHLWLKVFAYSSCCSNRFLLMRSL
jgi:hypothetical protein